MKAKSSSDKEGGENDEMRLVDEADSDMLDLVDGNEKDWTFLQVIVVFDDDDTNDDDHVVREVVVSLLMMIVFVSGCHFSSVIGRRASQTAAGA